MLKIYLTLTLTSYLKVELFVNKIIRKPNSNADCIHTRNFVENLGHLSALAHRTIMSHAQAISWQFRLCDNIFCFIIQNVL